MNQNDRAEPRKDKRMTLSIPIHKLWNWFRIRRIKNQLEDMREYETTVHDYRQDQ